MSSSRRIAVLIGILLIAGMVFGVLSSVPALEYPDFLVKLSSIKAQVLMAVFFQFAMATVYVWVAVLFYPIVKKCDERVALGYLGFRIIGAAFLYSGIVSLLLLLFVSRGFVDAGPLDQSQMQVLGELLRVGRDWMNHIGVILPWSIGGFVLYCCFLKTKPVPGWLSVWGLAGAALTLVATFLYMFDIIKIVSNIYFILNTPTALFELVLAIFLMVKGFNSDVADSSHG